MRFSTHELTSGVRLHLFETDKFNTVTCKMFIQQELARETASATALLPMLLRRGSNKFPTSRQLAAELESLYGASFGADIAKVGERQIIDIYFDMVDPTLLPEGVEMARQGFQTFWDIVTDPVLDGAGFRAEYFTQEQTALRREVEGLVNDKRAYANYRAIAEMCEDEPFGTFKYGDVESIALLDPEQTYRYYQEILANNPIDIFVVSRKVAPILSIFEDFSLERGEQKPLKPTVHKEIFAHREVQEAKNVQQAILFMGYRTKTTYLDENYYSLVVCNGILGAFPHSKLFVNVREKASLAYYVGSSLEGSKGLVTINAGIDRSCYEQAVQIIREQVEELQQGNISDEELAKTKKALANSIMAMADNPSAIIDRNIIGIIHGKQRSVPEVISLVEGVTKEDVQQAASTFELDTVYFLRGPEKEGTNGRL